MFTYEHYKDIFRLIDDALYDQIAYRDKSGSAAARETRINRIDLEKKRAQKVITAYIDERAALIQKIIMDDRFARIPMPDQPTRPELMSEERSSCHLRSSGDYKRPLSERWDEYAEAMKALGIEPDFRR